MEKTKNRSYNERHPELEEGEMFLQNINYKGDDYSHIGWETKRKGNQAYSIDGKTLRYLIPIFIQRNEYEESMKKEEEAKTII